MAGPGAAARFDSLVYDLRHATRSLCRRPAIAALAIGTLAIGIGTSTAMFSLLEAVVLRPLRLPGSEHVVRLSYSGAAAQFGPYLSGPDFDDLRATLAQTDGAPGERPYVDLAAVQGWLPTLVTDQGGRRTWGGRVSPGFFRMLGVSVALGRDFALDDIAAGEAVILGHDLWQSAFAGDVDIVGRRIEMRPRTYTVIGVLPPGLDLPGGFELWIPLNREETPWITDREVHAFLVYGRVGADVSLSVARAHTAQVGARLAQSHPDTNEGLGVDATRLRSTVAEGTRRPLAMLLGAVLMVLLVACANVANLLLASGLARGEEFAMCQALGCTRGRLLRRVLAEALLVATAAGALGVLAASVALDAIRSVAPGNVPRLEGLAINPSVVGFAAVLALVSTVLAGLAPALRAVGDGSVAWLRGGRSGAGRGHPGRVLVVAEFALCAVLLVGAGLFLRSLGHLGQVDVGLDYEGVQSFRAAVGSGRDPAATTDAIRRGLERLGGVGSVVTTSHVPLSGAYMNVPVIRRDQPVRGIDRPHLAYRMVSPGYLETLGIEVRRGRTLNRGDGADGRRVAVVNEAAARLMWGGEDPVGRLVALADRPTEDEADAWIEIVGVVGDVRQGGPGSPPMPALYVPYAQGDRGWGWIASNIAFLLRPAGGTPVSEARMREAVRQVGADIAVFSVGTLAGYLGSSMEDTRFAGQLLRWFAGLAFVLAAIGIYGVVAFGVRRRTRDIRHSDGTRRRPPTSATRRGRGSAANRARRRLRRAAAGVARGQPDREPVAWRNGLRCRHLRGDRRGVGGGRLLRGLGALASGRRARSLPGVAG